MANVPPKFSEIVTLIADRLVGLNYAIRGTASLVLQGYDMNVADVDVLADENAALACNDLFKEFLVGKGATRVAYRESEKFKSYYGKFLINNVEVEVMGEWQIKSPKGVWGPVYNASERYQVEVGGSKVWVTTVESELGMYAEMGRWNAYHKLLKQFNERAIESV